MYCINSVSAKTCSPIIDCLESEPNRIYTFKRQRERERERKKEIMSSSHVHQINQLIFICVVLNHKRTALSAVKVSLCGGESTLSLWQRCVWDCEAALCNLSS